MGVPSESEVRELFVGDTEATTGAVNFHAEAANDLVQDRIPTADLDADKVDRITRLVAAHFVASSDPTEQSESVGEASASYERPTNIGDGLEETRFGRRALDLDPTGGLAAGGADSGTFEVFGP